MRSNACLIGIKTIALLCKEEISIQEKQVDFISSMVILKACFFPSSRYSLLSMVEGGWLKMPPKRKFRELKTVDEEKAL